MGQKAKDGEKKREKKKGKLVITMAKLRMVRLSFSPRAYGYYPQEICRKPQEILDEDHALWLEFKGKFLDSNYRAQRCDLLPIYLESRVGHYVFLSRCSTKNWPETV